MPDVEPIRIPDEILFILDSICERFPKIAKIEKDEVSLSNLSEKDHLALDFMAVPRVVDEIIFNINIVMSDLVMLAASSRSFNDSHPFRRYKLLVRTFFYEFGRFEDAFGYFTLWMQRKKFITKPQRRSLMDDFYTQIKPIVAVRNICLHDDPSWRASMSPEIAILEGMDLFGMQAKDKSGDLLTWEKHLGPLCLKMEKLFYAATSDMRTTWNMLVANAAGRLVDDGKLARAKRRFVPKNVVRSRSKKSAARILMAPNDEYR